jgi:hypothetical protein
MATDPTVTLRRAQAKAADTPGDTLRALADDPDDAVRAAVAAHRNAPVATVERLVYDSVAAVRAKARSNRALPRADKARLTGITEEHVLRVHLERRVAEGAPRAEAFRARIAACDPDGATLPAALRKRLAEALTANPSPDAWRALCDALEGARWTDDLLAAALAWLTPSLAAWPDALRVTDPRWMQRLDKGLDDPRLALARVGCRHRHEMVGAVCPPPRRLPLDCRVDRARPARPAPRPRRGVGALRVPVARASARPQPLRHRPRRRRNAPPRGLSRPVGAHVPAPRRVRPRRAGLSGPRRRPLRPIAPAPRPRGQRQGLARAPHARDAHRHLDALRRALVAAAHLQQPRRRGPRGAARVAPVRNAAHPRPAGQRAHRRDGAPARVVAAPHAASGRSCSWPTS